MVKLRCPSCGTKFEYSWLKWIWKAPIHYFCRRLTKCPSCGAKNWIRREKAI